MIYDVYKYIVLQYTQYAYNYPHKKEDVNRCILTLFSHNRANMFFFLLLALRGGM